MKSDRKQHRGLHRNRGRPARAGWERASGGGGIAATLHRARASMRETDVVSRGRAAFPETLAPGFGATADMRVIWQRAVLAMPDAHSISCTPGTPRLSSILPSTGSGRAPFQARRCMAIICAPRATLQPYPDQLPIPARRSEGPMRLAGDPRCAQDDRGSSNVPRTTRVVQPRHPYRSADRPNSPTATRRRRRRGRVLIQLHPPWRQPHRAREFIADDSRPSGFR